MPVPRKAEQDAALFDEREIEALAQENKGTRYHRIGIIADHAFDAHVEAALKADSICKFSNKYGCCKLIEGHEGDHTVVDFPHKKEE